MGQAERFESRWVMVDGARMHACVATPPAPAIPLPIVMVHGLAVSHRYLMPTADLLAAEAAVYVPDLPGFGLSDDPGRILDMEEQAVALGRWMDATGLPRAAFVANSSGCQTVTWLAARQPERVACAILVGPTMDRRARTALQQIGRWLWDGRHERPAVIPMLLRDAWDAGLPRVFGTLRHALRDRIEDRLPHLPMPVLVVRGERDPIVPPRWAEEVARLLPRGRLIVVPGAPHNTNHATPRHLARVTRAFLGIQRVAAPKAGRALRRGAG